ncbi:FtsX-like permease family protein [Lentilactobacillus parafarraginis]|nr:FtsX-like permease family protein [Lentilactobacillus parafarraginis]
MLFKISLSGVKARWKDYLVLFSGMIMASAIFYMFEAIALNNKFVLSTTVGQNAKAVFVFGSILLVMITLVYVFYANNFLMSMRKHDYGLFMMLGAKSKKISSLITLETLVVGLISTVVGTIVGVGLTQLVSGVLVNSLAIPLKHFTPFYLPAVWTTLLLFMVLFVIAGFMNARTFIKTPALQLLRSESLSDWKQPKTSRLVIQAILGIVLLAVGYYAMYDIRHLLVTAIPIGLITIVFGTYFVFNSFFVMLLQWLQRSSFNQKGINSFTIAQLKFRISDYTKILSVVSLLFALALGAITVGVGFQNDIPELANGSNAYAIVNTNPSSKMTKLIDQVDGKTVSNYQQKIAGKTVYYRIDQFKEKPIFYSSFVMKGKDAGTAKVEKSSTTQLANPNSEANRQFKMLQNPTIQGLRVRFVSDATFNQLGQSTNQLQLVRVHDLNGQYHALKAVHAQQKAEMGAQAEALGESFITYTTMKSMFASMEFMGIFLGIAFLAMLASCLMFKILSGADSDKIRFEMLNKIGTRKQTLRKSIRLQILGLFGLPAILGLIDVAFGLQMFIRSGLLYHAYGTFAYSAIGFVVLYLIYFGITVLIYQKIVIPETSTEK